MPRTSVFVLSAILFATACGGGASEKLKAYEAREQRTAHQLELFDELGIGK